MGGYIIEGHVPASDIRRLLNERPKLMGLTAPGMPQMSPGMFSIEPKGYDVLQFNAETGSQRVLQLLVVEINQRNSLVVFL